MVLQDLLLALLLINCIALSSQSCGTAYCSQEYEGSCEEDSSCLLYDNCMASQSGCNTTVGPARNLSVDCYDTCIVGHPIDPSIPLRCCGDSIDSNSSDTMSITDGQNYLIARLYSLNELGAYRHNTFCKYNVQCPDENFDLYYLMVRFNVEEPVENGTCLDFLRYHFTATGASVESDACGELDDLPDLLKGGAHGSALTLDFRSNRMDRGIDFFLAVTCVNNTQSGARRKRDTSLVANFPKLTEEPLVPGDDCLPSMSLDRKVVSVPNIDVSDQDYIDEVFAIEKLSDDEKDRLPVITVTRAGVVKYIDNTIIVEHEGEILYKFRRIKVLHLYNKIEGYLTFNGHSSPKGRDFPGYGILQIGKSYAQYYQTLIDPRYLLNDEEEDIVRDLYKELFTRETIDDDAKSSVNLLRPTANQINCRINELAQLNSQACTDVVRAAANFFLEEDSFQDFCNEDR